jgi:hypothetical protein
MQSASRRTGSEPRDASPSQHAAAASHLSPTTGRGGVAAASPGNDRGLSEVSTGAGGPGGVAPFSGTRSQAFCDTTTVLLEKEGERLDHLMVLAYEAPTGDFFRQKKPTGLLQDLIDACQC